MVAHHVCCACLFGMSLARQLILRIETRLFRGMPVCMEHLTEVEIGRLKEFERLVQQTTHPKLGDLGNLEDFGGLVAMMTVATVTETPNALVAVCTRFVQLCDIHR